MYTMWYTKDMNNTNTTGCCEKCGSEKSYPLILNIGKVNERRTDSCGPCYDNGAWKGAN